MEGRKVVVTGGAGRLGSALIEAVCQRGAHPIAVVMNEEKAARVRAGVPTQIVNVTDEASVVEGFRAMGVRHGNLDGLIHTVGGWGMTPLLETSLKDWEQLVRLNLSSAFLCFREAAKHMQQGGALVAIASGQGADRGAPGQGAYSAAKAGVVRLVEAVSGELADRSIRTLAVAPSMILFDPESDEKGVHVADVVEACLSAFGGSPPRSGETLRVYGSLA